MASRWERVKAVSAVCWCQRRMASRWERVQAVSAVGAVVAVVLWPWLVRPLSCWNHMYGCSGDSPRHRSRPRVDAAESGEIASIVKSEPTIVSGTIPVIGFRPHSSEEDFSALEMLLAPEFELGWMEQSDSWGAVNSSCDVLYLVNRHRVRLPDTFLEGIGTAFDFWTLSLNGCR
jgi:hypothetical protein